MSGEILSRALNDISDELLCGAMRVREKKRIRARVFAAVAAAVVLLGMLNVTAKLARKQTIRTAPGVITVLAHGVDENGNPTESGEKLEEGESFRPNPRQEADDCQIFSFSFQVDKNLYSGMELSLQVGTTAGIFCKNEMSGDDPQNVPEVLRLLMCYYGQEYETKVGQNVYWQTDGFDYVYMQQQAEQGNYDYSSVYLNRDFENGPAYIHAILMADGHIVGFCLVKISLVDDAKTGANREFSFQVISSASYPQVDGCWQDVTKEDVYRQILDARLVLAQQATTATAND